MQCDVRAASDPSNPPTRPARQLSLSRTRTRPARQGYSHFRRAKSRAINAARGCLLSRFTEEPSKRYPFVSKMVKRRPKGNLVQPIFTRWHAFWPIKNAGIPAVRGSVRETWRVQHAACDVGGDMSPRLAVC
ncbi:hypothetical protein L227DRAFT_575766 [Lentinus tigrinus ALCF2SS1-6]|uniref:Uncharacterized protein n=1 Tax=Lentinus tigrinus ALCF2SS1-6 TaxID=1328759 RepID=A0A5C2S7D0_9APHY|nr:hypothetical protein L227DRAFT_575766 [Lentinus tigrinus ALCF2SS1-6]